MKISKTPQFNNNCQNSLSHKNNISFEAIQIRQINPAYAHMRTQLENELEVFVRTEDNAKMLGAGVSSAVYRFERLKDIVFKKSLKQNDSFNEEVEHLRMLPQALKNVQKFVAQAFDDETGLFYLLSTRMNGKEADWKKNPWTREHFKNFFSTLFELDKNGIYHGDLHCGNILLDGEGNANLIDFQWTQKLLRSEFFINKPNCILPPFIMSENSQMFEMAGIPYYIKFMSNTRQGKRFLQDYLKEKANYHQQRSYFLRAFFERLTSEKEKINIIKGINYEDAQSIILRKPDDDVLRIETKKLQFLSNFRESCSRGDFNNPTGNYVTATSANLMTLSAIQDLRHEIALQKRKKFLSSAKKDYLKYTEEYAIYWCDSVSSWVGGVFEMSLRTAENTKYSRDNIIFDSLENLTDLYKFIGEKNRGRYNRGFEISDLTADKFKEIEAETKNIKREYIYLDFDAKIMRKINEIQKLNDRLKKALKDDCGFDVLNLSILSIVKNRELYSILEGKPNTETRNLIMYQLYQTKELYKSIAQSTYRQIFSQIWLDAPEKRTITHFNGIYDFG